MATIINTAVKFLLASAMVLSFASVSSFANQTAGSAKISVKAQPVKPGLAKMKLQLPKVQAKGPMKSSVRAPGAEMGPRAMQRQDMQ